MNQTRRFYMKKRIILSAAILMSAATLPAEVLSPGQALLRLRTERAGTASARAVADKDARLLHTSEGETGPASYVFGAGGNGFVVVSADDRLPALLGWSETGCFDEREIPCGLQTQLDLYARQADALRAGDTALRARRQAAGEDDREPVGPTLTTRWSQDAPYNDLCPVIGSRRCVTGCVATAMAQVLRHYAWSGLGEGVHSMEFGYLSDEWEKVTEILEFDFAERPFDYSVMADDYTGDYTPESAAEVARLMYACGISVDMIYGTSSSGSFDGYMPYALWKHFGFDAGVRLAERDCFREIPGMTWEDFVYDQLSRHGALIYCGVTSANEGHAFVCDGYLEDGYFHFNWGWGGMSDGWFLLDALEPTVQGTGGSSRSLGFNYGQSIQADLDPEEGTGIYLPAVTGRAGKFDVITRSTRAGEKFTVTGEVLNFCQSALDLEFGCLLAADENGVTGETIKVCDLSLGTCEAKKIYTKATFPAGIADGTYCMRPVVKGGPLTDWWTLPWNVAKDHVWIRVENGEVTFNVEAPGAGIGFVTDDPHRAAGYYSLQGTRLTSAPEDGTPFIVVDGTGRPRKITQQRQ